MKRGKSITVMILILSFLLVSINAESEMKPKNNTKTDNKVLLPVKNDPTISFSVWFKVGSQNDPKGKEGLANLTTMLLSEGATKFNTYEQILEKLYPLAASYSGTVDKEMTVFRGRTHKDNLKEFYTLYIQAILNPAFSETDFTRLKSDVLNYIENELRYSSDEELGKEALNRFVFEGTAYEHLTEGTIESVKSITIEDVKAFYARHFTAGNLVIGIGGGYSKDLPTKLEKDLSILGGTDNETLPPSAIKPQPRPIRGMEVNIIDKKCDATAISFGFPIDVLRGDKDFFALYLFNSWFGEHRNQSSHLYQVIREKRGLNYGDYSYIEAFLHGGGLNVPEPNTPRKQQLFEVWIRPVQHQYKHFALRAAVRELKKVVQNGLTQEQLDLTKKYLYNYSLFYAQTTSKRLGYQLDSKFYGVEDGGNYIELFRQKIKALTLAEVNAAIKKHLQFSNLKIAIVTSEASKLASSLSADAPSPVKYDIPMTDDVLKEDKEIEAFQLRIDPNKIKIFKIEDMFLK